MKQIPCVVLRDLNRYLDDCERRDAYLAEIDELAGTLLPYDLIPELNLAEIKLYDTNMGLLLGRKATPASEEKARTELTDLFDTVARRTAEKIYKERMDYLSECAAMERFERLTRRFA